MVVENVRNYNTGKGFYLFHDSRLSFEEANQHCITHHDGTLALPNDDESLSAISRELKTQFNEFGAPFYRIGLSRQNNTIKWINGIKFTGGDLSNRPDATESCIGFAVRHEVNITRLRFHSWNCSYPLRYVCEKQNQKAIEKFTTPRATTKKSISTKIIPTTAPLPSPSSNTAKEERITIVDPSRIPKTLVNVVENTSTTFPSSITGSSNLALLAGCISAACVILALIAVAIFLIARRKQSPDSTKKSSEENVHHGTVPLQQEDTSEKRDVSSDYATLKEQGGYSSVPLDYDHMVLHPSSACPQVTYAEIDKHTNIHENVANSNDSPNVATVQTQNDDVKALYATVNKNR